MIEVSRKEIERYLGYKGTAPDARVSAEIDKVLEELNRAAAPAHIFQEFPLEIRQAAAGLSFAGLAVQSASLSRSLAGCHKIVVLAATIGIGADRLIARAQVRSMMRSSVFQAAGAAMIEAYVNDVNRKLRDAYAKKGLYLRPRFSPGYGDLSLALQKDIVRILNTPKTIGVSLTDGCLMVPSKSVTALIGVSAKEERCILSGCEECNARDTCAFRR